MLLPLHQAGGEEVGVRCRGAHAAVGGLHDCGEDKTAVDAGCVGDVDDRFVDRGGFVFGVAGDFPGVAGFFNDLLVGSEPGNCQLGIFSLLLLIHSHVVEGEPVSLRRPSFSFGAVTGVTLVSLCGA